MIKELKKEVETLHSTSTLFWILKEIQNQQDDSIEIVCKVSRFASKPIDIRWIRTGSQLY